MRSENAREKETTQRAEGNSMKSGDDFRQMVAGL